MADDKTKIVAELVIDDSQAKKTIANWTKQNNNFAQKAQQANQKVAKQSKASLTQQKQQTQVQQQAQKSQQQHIAKTTQMQKQQIQQVAQQQQKYLRQAGGGPGGPGGGRGGRGGGGGPQDHLGFASGRGKWAGKMGGMGRFGMLGLGGGAVLGAAALYAGGVFRHGMQGYNAYVASGNSRAALHGMGTLNQVHRHAALGESLGYNLTEMRQGAKSVGRNTGNIGAVDQAAILSRYYGGSMDEVASHMGALTRSGTSFAQKGQGSKSLRKIMEDAVASGLDKSRAGEHLESVSSMIGQVGSRQTKKVDAAGISGLLSLLGKVGGEGFRGARGMALLSEIDSGIRSGGRDEYSDAFIMQSIGFGVAGSGMSYWDALKTKEAGLFGGDQVNTGLLDNIIANAKADGQDLDGTALHLHRMGVMGGLTAQQIEDFLVAYEGAKEGGDMEKTLKDWMDKAQPIDVQMLKINEDMLEIAKKQSERANKDEENGEELYKAVTDMQDILRSLWQTGIPTLVSILETIRDAVVAVARTFGADISAEGKALGRDIYKAEDVTLHTDLNTHRTAIDRHKKREENARASYAKAEELLAGGAAFDSEVDELMKSGNYRARFVAEDRVRRNALVAKAANKAMEKDSRTKRAQHEEKMNFAQLELWRRGAAEMDGDQSELLRSIEEAKAAVRTHRDDGKVGVGLQRDGNVITVVVEPGPGDPVNNHRTAPQPIPQ